MKKVIKRLTSESPKARITRILRAWIKDGTFEKGSPLPSERKLCREFGVNQWTMQKVLEFLEGEKLIVRKGLRTRIVPIVTDAGAASEMLQDTVVFLSNFLPPAASRGSGWSGALMTGAMDELRNNGLNVLVFNQKNFHMGLDRFITQKPFGILSMVFSACDPAEEEIIGRLLKSNIPMVSHWDDAKYRNVDRVISDNEHGSFELTRKLIAEGHKKIMMILRGDVGNYWIRGRIAGYEKAMAEAGLEPMPPLTEILLNFNSCDIRGRWEASSRYHAGGLSGYMSVHGRPEAIMTLSDGAVFSVAAACRTLGLEPGKDIVITGYDNYWSKCQERNFEPYVPAFTVDKLNSELGREMVRLLIQRKNGELPAEPQLRLIKPRILQITDSVSKEN